MLEELTGDGVIVVEDVLVVTVVVSEGVSVAVEVLVVDEVVGEGVVEDVTVLVLEVDSVAVLEELEDVASVVLVD